MKWHGEYVKLELEPSEFDEQGRRIFAAGKLNGLRVDVTFQSWRAIELRLMSACCDKRWQFYQPQALLGLASWEIDLLGGPAGAGTWLCSECAEPQPWVNYHTLTVGVQDPGLPEALDELESWFAHSVTPFEQRLAALELVELCDAFLDRAEAAEVVSSWPRFRKFLEAEGLN